MVLSALTENLTENKMESGVGQLYLQLKNPREGIASAHH
jgi:hypothetical protein